jgi:Domain of unknown function (DUF4878)
VKHIAKGLPRRLLIFCLCLSYWACTNKPDVRKSPGDAVRSFLLAANEGRYSEVEAMFAYDAKNAIGGTAAQMAGGVKTMCDSASRNGTISKVEITSEEVRGEGATVVARIMFKDGSSEDSFKANLVKEKGVWRFTLGS